MMHQYSNVDAVTLNDQQVKNEKVTIDILSLQEASDKKTYAVLVKDGMVI